MTILSTACERAGLEGRDVRSLRVSSTHAFEESLSRRSEISSRGDWVGTTGFLGSEVSLGFVDELDLVIGACLGPTLTLGADFAVLPFFTVVVAVFRAGFSVTGQGAGQSDKTLSCLEMAQTEKILCFKMQLTMHPSKSRGPPLPTTLASFYWRASLFSNSS